MRLQRSENAILAEMIVKMFKDKTFEQLGFRVQERNRSVIGEKREIAFLRNRREISIFPRRWNMTS